jgi:hypothetical protein
VTPGKSGRGGVYPSGGASGRREESSGMVAFAGGEGAPVVVVECDEVLLFYELNFDRNSLKISRTLEFDEIWLARSLLHLIARKNQFPSKEDQNFEFH